MLFFFNTTSAQSRLVIDTVNYRWALSEASKALIKEQEALADRADYSVKGKLKDEHGELLVGGLVKSADGAILATADENGAFSFRLPGRPANAYTVLVAEAAGKQKAVRSIHYTGFPAILDIVLVPPVMCCDSIIKERCCDINISWPVDRLFVETNDVLPLHKKARKKLHKRRL